LLLKNNQPNPQNIKITKIIKVIYSPGADLKNWYNPVPRIRNIETIPTIIFLKSVPILVPIFIIRSIFLPSTACALGSLHFATSPFPPFDPGFDEISGADCDDTGADADAPDGFLLNLLVNFVIIPPPFCLKARLTFVFIDRL
jgi:hypothetical protein